ncbi:MAG TPA: hypothetical protein VKT52_12685 [Ktedonobacterales bacterium]|nr:hypothetical protein [Ktedonobacterales bacterium]
MAERALGADVFERADQIGSALIGEPPPLLPLGTGPVEAMPHHFSMVPHEFVDRYIAHLGPVLSVVWLYVYRRTRGYGETVARPRPLGVSIAQLVEGLLVEGARLDNGVGLKRAAVVRALTSLESRGLLCKVREGDRGRHLAALYAIPEPHLASISQLRPARK